MKTTTQPDIAKTVAQVVELLVAGDYAAIEQLCGAVRLGADDLRRAVQGYRWRLLPPPPEHYQLLQVQPVEGEDGARHWSVVMPLWREPGLRSDLCLELSLIELPDGRLRVEVDDLHAL